MLSLIVLGIGLFLLHLVIKSAIDNSDAARDIKEIKILLFKIHECMEKEDSPKSIEAPPEEIIEEECPACHANISIGDKVCPSCGLTLVIDD